MNMNHRYDPTDHALLVAGFSTAGQEVSISDSEELLNVAKLLHVQWCLVQDEWNNVWAYTVAEPLGWWIADNLKDGRFPERRAIIAEAQYLIREAMGE